MNAEDMTTALLEKFFPEDLPALDSEEQNTVRTRVTARCVPATQLEPDFTHHKFEEAITRLNNHKCQNTTASKALS